jgi:hypothetical protein
MNANEIIPSCAIENGTFVPAAITPVAAADPAPTYIRHAVPSNSAKSFCGMVGGADVAMRFARRQAQAVPGGELLTSLGVSFVEYCSTMPNNI